MSSELAMFETPFADTLTLKEAIRSNEPAEVAYNNFLQELESPFTRTYEVSSSGAIASQVSEEFVQFLGELNDNEFTDALYELAPRWKINGCRKFPMKLPWVTIMSPLQRNKPANSSRHS